MPRNVGINMHACGTRRLEWHRGISACMHAPFCLLLAPPHHTLPVSPSPPSRLSSLVSLCPLPAVCLAFSCVSGLKKTVVPATEGSATIEAPFAVVAATVAATIAATDSAAVDLLAGSVASQHCLAVCLA